jgi:hypothetical protein
MDELHMDLEATGGLGISNLGLFGQELCQKSTPHPGVR